MSTPAVHQPTGRRLKRTRTAMLAGALALTSGIVIGTASTSGAVPNAPGTVFDDFEDGDAADWIFFGGNAAGGGGGTADDRPAEGSYYLSTGWGGDGTTSGFYGGTFKNLDDLSQLALPADPWFNMWVLNQSDASVDQYDLELTLREDTDGNGWTDGAEDSIGLDTTFTSARFDDQWTLLSAPLSSWFDRGTGGNGVFDGNVDEMVIVFGGVQGGATTNIEVDFDTITFTSGAPAGFDEIVFDDMEHGDPVGNGWFAFNGAVGGGGIGPNTADLPPTDGGAFSLETGWGSGGTPGFYGGFGRTSPTDLSGTEFFNFWINPDAGQDYTLEINLQDDDNADGAINPPDDDEFQFDCVVSATGPCAVSGGGWQLVSLTLDDFFDDNSFLTGGNGVLDPTPPARGGNGELISAVVAVIGAGSDVNFRTDHWTFTSSAPVQQAPSTVVDDFETGLPFGSAVPNGEPLGFYTFQGDGSVAIATATTPPAPELPAVGTPNNLMQMDVDVASFAGFIHAFENPAVDTWVTQDWSTSEGISFWMYGSNTGTQMFIDILDNRNPGSTTDDAERFTVPFVDDFTGWQLLEFPFATFVRKEIGNGAPNDGLGLFEMHGYALGTLGTGGPQTFYFDEVSVYGVAEPPDLAVNFSRQNTFIEEGTTGDVGVKLNRPMGPDDPAQVSIDFATERSNAIAGEDFTPTSGTLTFTNGGPTELFFPVETFDDTKFTGDLQVVIRLTNPVDVDRGALFQGSVLIDDNDPFDPDLLDDFEQGAFLWDSDGMVELEAQRVAVGDADERPGQDPAENVAKVSVPDSGPALDTRVEAVVADLEGLLPASTRQTTRRIQRAIDRLNDSLDPMLWHNGFFLDEDHGDAVFNLHRRAVRELHKIDGAEEAPTHAALDEIVAVDGEIAQLILDVSIANGGDAKNITKAQHQMDEAWYSITYHADAHAVGHYRKAWRFAVRSLADVDDATLGSLTRDFPIGQDWTGTESLDFWFQGTGSGEEITVDLKDNRAPDPGPAGWTLAWADEFDEPAGTPPNPANWAYEIGDTTPDGKNGWGNEELQYYTDDPDNAQTDGDGNLIIKLDEADGSQECYYGPCEFESARLVTQNKAEFAYGRIESRIQVPTGGDGLWPAFWSLGTDITYNPWPGAGEIDVMEYVSRIPNEIFGTIHGPGYNGGGAFGNIYDFGERVDLGYHTFTVEWEPNLITWYVDGIQYHQATPADVPGPWVFEKPFFLLLNFAIGGNFGGAIDPANTYPQEYLVDYVRVYQGPDSAERFETTFTDSTAGWQEVSIPIGDFVRSSDQPAGAPDDGLTLTDVWGYGFDLPYPAAGDFRFDLVRRTPVPPPSEVVVTTLDDSGPGSLREALSLIADDGTITFDPAVAGGTLTLTSGQLTVDRSVTVVGPPAAPVTISAGGASRVVQIGAGIDVSMSDLVIRDGVAAPQGGGILNAGTLSLDRVTVTENQENSAGPADFQFGGGGIYNGDGAVLNLTDSIVSDNATVAQPGGGVYGFFNSTINLTDTTISGNVAGDVAGGLRTLGNADISGSTISGNTSTAWHGGGIFATDGTVTIIDTEIVDNVGAPGTAGGLMVATFGAPVTVTLQDSTVTGNVSYGCQVEGGSAAVLTSLGGNTFSDASCNPTGDDVVLP
ncbi:carbohydrate binding domain-containing protein [Ilumatobacter sp.]|uniref:carbohydrate binding domain-containing protein n=1 Tax=Ilumatobacter sp. TaxID=1967498 RepID=UPI003AF5B497